VHPSSMNEDRRDRGRLGNSFTRALVERGARALSVEPES
jgi:hypothetical protein